MKMGKRLSKNFKAKNRVKPDIKSDRYSLINEVPKIININGLSNQAA